jgi:hypothetical protein
VNPYIRAAQKHPHICDQIAERASKRPEWAGKAAMLQRLQAEVGKLRGKADKFDRERARNVLGQFKGDNPETPEINEAWEPVPAAPEPPKRDRSRE